MILDDRRFLCGLVTALLSVTGLAGAEDMNQILAASLAKADTAPSIPGLSGVTREHLLAKPQAAAVVEWARGAKDETIPLTTYTQYRRFREAGERGPYERPYFDKRDLLARAVLSVWLDGDLSSLPQVNDLIWNICEESTWVVPAHEKQPWFIDLFCSETAATLSHIRHLLSAHLPQEIQDRMVAEVTRRVLDPFIEHGRDYSWGAGRNNWTGVCAGSVGQAFLLLERDPERYVQAIGLVIEYLRNFIANAFETDGASLEGVSYWNYGLAEYMVFAEMLRERTDGRIDLLAEEKLQAIARFPIAVAMGPRLFASFSDSHESGYVRAYIGKKLIERTGVTELAGLLQPKPDFRVHETICDLLWWDGTTAAQTALQDIVLADSGLARLVDTSRGHTLVVAAKAGHNEEPHNQNDVGSFIVSVDNTVYLCDPGAGLYSKDYFSARRYENIFCNSYGHSVPRIGGKLQGEGKRARGTIESNKEKSVRIDFDEAYPKSGLSQATRDVALCDGAVLLDDRFTFSGDGSEVEEAFVTWLPVEVEGPVARLISDSGILEMRADNGTFQIERLEDACRENHKSCVLSRLTVTYPAQKETAASFRMTFRAKQ